MSIPSLLRVFIIKGVGFCQILLCLLRQSCGVPPPLFYKYVMFD